MPMLLMLLTRFFFRYAAASLRAAAAFDDAHARFSLPLEMFSTPFLTPLPFHA